MINSGSEVNAITPDFATKLGLTTRKTNVGAQKIDGLVLKTYSMIIAKFLLQDKLKRPQFFEKTFLLADKSIKVIFGKPFFTLSNADVDFPDRELQ